MLVILRISKLYKRIFSFTKSGLINEIKVLADSEQRLRCNNPTSVWTCVSTIKYRIRGNHPDATAKDHIVEIPQSSGFLAIKVNDNQLKTIEKE